MRTNERTTMFVNFSQFEEADSELAETILGDFYKYEPALRAGLQEFMLALFPEYAASKLFFLAFHNLTSIEK
jgi:DNA replicative helicase MCM subunit Mcm2 (Cdc46/Mcm family)